MMILLLLMADRPEGPTMPISADHTKHNIKHTFGNTTENEQKRTPEIYGTKFVRRKVTNSKNIIGEN